MKISFLVTYYQQKQYVDESINSILNLKKPPEWELLIGDDGSVDGTAEKAREYVNRDPAHIRLFVMDRDPQQKYHAVERASLNRLNLLRHASGGCYCLLDGDDFYLDPDFVPQAVSLLESHPEVSVIAYDTWMYREGQSRKAPSRQASRPALVPGSRYLRWQYTSAGACVIRNSHTPEELERLSSLGTFDDNDIVLSALARGEMLRIRRPVFAYRQTEGSVYSSMDPAERAALNVAGMGADLQIMGPKWEKDLLARCATAVWMAWFMRDHLEERIDPFRYRHYLRLCQRAGFVQGEALLRWPGLGAAERRKTRQWVYRAGRESPLRVAYAWILTRRGGSKHE